MDSQPVPCDGLARHDGSRVVMMERYAAHQDRGDDTVATQHGAQRINDDGRLGIGSTVPFDAPAERYSLRSAYDGMHGQGQVVNAVLAGGGYIAVVIIGSGSDTLTVQTIHAMPREVLVLADGHRLLKVITRLTGRLISLSINAVGRMGVYHRTQHHHTNE